MARQFFVVSDLHLDVAYDGTASTETYCHNDRGSQSSRPLGRPGCDSPARLVKSTLKQMRRVEPHPEFILVTGDVVAHDTYNLLTPDGKTDKSFNRRLVKATYDSVVELFKEFFPKTQVILTFGNNDGYGDYSVPSDPEAQVFWSELFELYSRLNPKISTTFLEGGFYTTKTETGLPVICLNSNFFSSKTESNSTSIQAQFDLLERFLENVDEPALIAMHIPPGADKYNGGADWHPEDIMTFYDIVSSNSDSVKMIMAGHFHSQTFQMISDQTTIVVHSSVSPIYGNNPMFRIYNDVANELEFVDYSFDLYSRKPTWKQEYASSLYGSSDGYYPTLFGLLANNNSDTRLSYMRNALGVSRSGLSDSNVEELYLGSGDDGFEVWMCTMAWVLPSDYSSCLEDNISAIYYS